ncbi:MAG: hypothetical protein AB8H03_22210, partial [Saprospiraceae bacterium]
KAKLWGLAAGAAVALGAIMVITRGGGKFLKVLKKISPKLGGIFDKKMALTTPDGQRINVSQKDLLGDGKDGRIKMEGKDGGGLNENRKKTNTVWDDIITTQSPYKNSVLPKSFKLQTNNGVSLWVHPNATKHIAEYVAMKAETHVPDMVRLVTQQQLRSLQAVINDIAEKGIIYDKIIVVDNWELKLGKPRQEGQLPVLFHALPLN